LFAVPFDSRSNQVAGNAAQVLEDAAVLSVATGVWIPMLGVDRGGSIAYLNKGGTLSTLRWIAPAPKAIQTVEADYRTPRLSPDGGRLVAVAGSAPSEIWVIDLERGTRLLLGTSGGVSPVWSHDGRRVIYSSAAGDIRAVPADGSGAPELVLPRVEGFNLAATGVAPDGSFTVVQADNRAASADGRNRDVWIVRSGQKPDLVAATAADERNGVVSPDGQWLAYSSSVSGREEIYLKNLAGSGRTIPVSSEGGTLPRWPRTDSLYFLGPRTLMRAPIRTSPFSVGTPVEAAQLPQNVSGLDVHADGRILIIEPKVAGIRDALHVRLNWGPSLK
jgi:Tol biopolymer transport system component